MTLDNIEPVHMRLEGRTGLLDCVRLYHDRSEGELILALSIERQRLVWRKRRPTARAHAGLPGRKIDTDFYKCLMRLLECARKSERLDGVSPHQFVRSAVTNPHQRAGIRPPLLAVAPQRAAIEHEH